MTFAGAGFTSGAGTVILQAGHGGQTELQPARSNARNSTAFILGSAGDHIGGDSGQRLQDGLPSVGVATSVDLEAGSRVLITVHLSHLGQRSGVMTGTQVSLDSRRPVRIHVRERLGHAADDLRELVSNL